MESDGKNGLEWKNFWRLISIYSYRRMVKEAEWVLSPHNRRRSLAGIIFAAIVLHRNGNRVQIERQITSLRQARDELQKVCRTFRSLSDDVLSTLKMRNLPLETYMRSVYQLLNQYVQSS